MSGTASSYPRSGPQGPAGNDNWVYQGRKEHGHFGDGTRPDPLADATSRTADEPLVPAGASFAAVVRGSIAALPPSDRARYERILNQGAAAQFETAMKIWARADTPNAAAFDATYVHGITSSETAARLWSIAVTAGATRTPAGLRNAAADFGTVMKTIGLDALPRGAAALAVRAQAGLLEQNARNLADLIYTEARGEGEKAQIAVGATVLNRMRRNGTDRVDDVRGGYSYLTPAPADKPAPAIARGLLVNSIKDPTNGATHFYSPKSMPKQGDKVSGFDIGGGLETVPGTARNGKTTPNYRPSFVLDKSFHEVPVADVPNQVFKFFKVDGNAPVR